MDQRDFEYLLNKVINGQGDSDKHLLTFFGIALNINARRILELGVRDGNSTVPWVCAANEIGGLARNAPN